MLHGSIEGFAGRRSSGSGRYGPRSNCGLDCTWDAGHFGFSGWFDLCLHAGIEGGCCKDGEDGNTNNSFLF